jgi:hypothetical protein
MSHCAFSVKLMLLVEAWTRSKHGKLAEGKTYVKGVSPALGGTGAPAQQHFG